MIRISNDEPLFVTLLLQKPVRHILKCYLFGVGGVGLAGVAVFGLGGGVPGYPLV